MGHLYHGYVSHNHRVESSHVFAADDLLRLLEVVWDPGTRRVGGGTLRIPQLLQGIEICTLGSTNWNGKQTSKLQYIYNAIYTYIGYSFCFYLFAYTNYIVEGY